jgi:hypothetical protein
MRILYGIVLSIGLLNAQQIDKKWATSQNCKACHTNITKKWELSRHANSHYSKNDLFKKSLDYIVKNNPTKILDEVKIECAKCHNPRIGESKVKKSDKISILFDDADTKKHYQDVLNSVSMKNGINCIVCHNIDKIHLDKKKGSEGMNSVVFGKQGVMFGPFKDAHSPYHQTEQREHFAGDNPKLCFVCHYGAKNHHGLSVYATGEEYDNIKAKANGKVPGCKVCHMSKRKRGFASNYAPEAEQPKLRMVRVHRFASVDNSDIMREHVKVNGNYDKTSKKFIVTIQNKTPHKLPTGYGSREVIVSVKYFDNNDKLISTSEYKLKAEYVDDKNHPTIPHMATKIASDTRLAPYSQRKLKFKVPKSATYVKYSLSYRLIDNELAHELGITDKFFLKDYTFFEQRVHL